MILLDTSVVSEAMKPGSDDAVRAWLDDQAAETLYLSSVTVAELMFGIGALPGGKGKDRLAEALGMMERWLTRDPVRCDQGEPVARCHGRLPGCRAARSAIALARSGV